MKPRTLQVVSMALVGLGLGVFVYRFAILGFFWSGSARWVFPALGAGLIAAGSTIARSAAEGERLSVVPRIAVSLAGAGIAVGILYLAVPSLDRITLTRMQLPGFAFDAPTARPDVEAIDYGTGTVTWKALGGANAILSITWQTGPASKDDLALGVKALANQVGDGTEPVFSTLPGPGGAAYDTATVGTNKKLPLQMTVLPCGNRALFVMSIGDTGIATVHARMLRSFTCTPDAAKESVPPGTVRVALSLPGWYVQEKQHGQVTLTDGRALLLVREVSVSQRDLPQLVPPLLEAFGGKFVAGAAVGDRVPFSGTIENEHIEGWARRVACPAHAVMLLAFASTREDAEAVYNASANAGCLRAGEAPPVWPDAPPAVAPDGAPETPPAVP